MAQLGVRSIALAAVGMGLVAFAIADPLGPAGAVCGEADKLHKHGLVSKAQEDYRAIFVADPDADCAREGIVATSNGLCARADELRLGGRAQEARDAYQTLLSVEPPDGARDCAQKGLEKLDMSCERDTGCPTPNTETTPACESPDPDAMKGCP